MSDGQINETLPRWDMGVVFPSPDSAAFIEAFRALQASLEGLGILFDDLGVHDSGSDLWRPATADGVGVAIDAYNEVLGQFGLFWTYLGGLTATDSRDDVAQSRLSELQLAGVTLARLESRWTAWIGPQNIEALIAGSPIAKAHAFFLRREAINALHQMSPAEETLAAELATSGAAAWGKLHDTVSSQIEAVVTIAGDPVTLPISEIRNLALSPNREVRKAAFEAEIGAWSHWAVPLAAAMNGIKGTGNTIAGRRGWDDQLDLACFQNHIDRETLDAMIEATREAFPAFRRYLHAKARLIGVERLAWFDLFAPVGDPGRSWEWLDAVGLLEARFSQFSPDLGHLMSRAVSERWIDAGPRSGKQGGAYCAFLRDDESRVLMNFTPSFDSVSTLAHEMGHAYHNYCERGLTPIQKWTPMTLAETASTFCETLVYEALIEGASGGERLFMLDQSLQGATQVAVDILSRYDFERAVFLARRERELTIGEFCELMTEAQRGTYGDGLDPALMHPWMWAVKGHYYADGEPFYNFPYLFGLLFGLGLYARYLEHPEGFVERYEELLRSTGMDDAASLAVRFGIDIHDGAFWRGSLATIVRSIDRFEAAVEAATAGR